MKEYLKHTFIALSMVLNFWVGMQIGKHKEASKIYKELNFETYKSWVAPLIEHEFDKIKAERQLWELRESEVRE